MTEDTINSMFSANEWQDAACAHCCEYTGCVSMADVPTCYGCLEKYYDEDGDELPMNVYTPEPSAQLRTDIRKTFALAAVGNFLLGVAATLGFVLLLLAPFLMDASEVIAFWQGGK
jgi:hypothetical protein